MKLYLFPIALGLVLSGCASSSNVVSMEEFGKVQNGMSLSQVESIVGEPGKQTVSQQMMGFTTEGYSWQNSDGSNMQCMFQNGKLMTKAQAGLR